MVVTTSGSRRLSEFVLLLLLLRISLPVYSSVRSNGTIYPGQSLNGNRTLTSPKEVFEMGFFTPGNSLNYYIGIWYKKPGDRTVVWVANRERPVSDSFFSALELSGNGNLALVSESKTVVWSSNSKSSVSNSTIGVLLDDGNFVIRDALDSSLVIWKSFDHPTDTWLPGGKVGYKKQTDEKFVLTYWRNQQNPAPGLFSLEEEQNGTSLFLRWNGSITYWTDYWSGQNFSRISFEINVTYVTNENESYFTFSYASNTRDETLTRLKMETTGQLERYVWREDYGSWVSYGQIAPSGLCDEQASCGSFGVCNPYNTPICACVEGFRPYEMPKDVGPSENHTVGCVRKTPLQCASGADGEFVEVPEVFLPSSSEYVVARNAEECRLACLSNNCSCTAYAYYEDQCLIWKGVLFNLKQRTTSAEIGQTLYVRVAASHLKETKAKGRKTPWIVILVLVGLFLLLVITIVLVRRRYYIGKSVLVENSLVLFSYRDLKAATKNFSEKLGEGGFGSVFKGTLQHDMTAVAVKKLKSLMQGEKQFRAEVMTLGTIKHANLIRLLGFCTENSKRFLVYDYMPNGSLESLLFRRSFNILNWEARYRIAIGTAKGLCYLHEECRDCIIHCDIKPENILLDEEYNPKLADFGLAKLIGRDFSRVLTTMRGTIGYLAPEWLSGEAITPKADVFSYGMLLFELISGRRNTEVYLDDETEHDEMDHYFPNRVSSSLQKGEDVLALLDCRLEGNADIEELTRACKVACWCIQDDEMSRPSMSLVVRVLIGVADIGVPSVPRFIQRLT